MRVNVLGTIKYNYDQAKKYLTSEYFVPGQVVLKMLVLKNHFVREVGCFLREPVTYVYT